jgi:hypothetical protein
VAHSHTHTQECHMCECGMWGGGLTRRSAAGTTTNPSGYRNAQRPQALRVSKCSHPGNPSPPARYVPEPSLTTRGLLAGRFLLPYSCSREVRERRLAGDAASPALEPPGLEAHEVGEDFVPASGLRPALAAAPTPGQQPVQKQYRLCDTSPLRAPAL